MTFSRFLLVMPLLVPGYSWSASLLTSDVNIPEAITWPPPSSFIMNATRHDNLAQSLSTTVGGYSVSGFAQSDYGRLSVSASSYMGISGSFYGYQSGSGARATEEFFVNAGPTQNYVSFVFELTSSVTADSSTIWGGEDLYFGASLVSRPGNGVGLLGTASCGISSAPPGNMDYGSAMGWVRNLNIPGSATCTLQVPVTAGETSMLGLDVQLVAAAQGGQVPSAVSATVTYATATPEPGTVSLLGASLLGLLTLAHGRNRVSRSRGV